MVGRSMTAITIAAITSTTRCSRQIDSVIENSVERPSSLFVEVFGVNQKGVGPGSCTYRYVHQCANRK